MGLLDRLRGRSVQMSVAVEPAYAAPGQDVLARITIEGEIDDKAEGAHVALRCVNRYIVREYDHHDDRMEEKWRSVTLHEETAPLPLEPGTHEQRFTIPAGAVPSSDDAIEWSVQAWIDRKRGIDNKGAQKVGVLLDAATLPAEREAPLPSAEGLSIETLPARVAAGRSIEGSLRITPAEDLKVTGVMVKLNRRRTYIDTDNTKVTKGGEITGVEVSGKREFAAGQSELLSFELPVPAHATPGVTTDRSVVEWEIEAILQRRMRGDIDIKAPVAIYNYSAASSHQ